MTNYKSLPPESEQTRAGIRSLAKLVNENDTFLLLTHVNPDGDALGALLGLALGLKSLGKTVRSYSESGTPQLYDFLPGVSDVATLVEAHREFDLAILLDCNEMKRAGKSVTSHRFKSLAVLDHHVVQGKVQADLPIIDTQSSSAGELVFHLLNELDVEITPDIATNLFTAITTDTGSFSFDNSGPRVFSIAAALTAAGASPWYIYQHISLRRSAASLRLLGRALARIEFHQEGRLGIIGVDRAMLDSTGTTETDTEGLAEYPRSVEGVELAVLVRENSAGLCHVSLRSQGRFNASALANNFGGGGHRNAAGFSMFGTVAEVADRVVSSAMDYYESLEEEAC